MSIYNWIFVSLYAIFVILFIIGYVLKNTIIERIATFALLPAAGILVNSFLIKYLPDSFHIMLVSTISFLTLSGSIIFFEFDKKRIFYITAMILFFASCGSWFYIFVTIYFLYHIPQALTTISIITYIALFIASMIFIGKQKLYVYLFSLISVGIISTLHYCSFVTLCFEQNLYSVLLFAGASINLIFTFYIILDRYKYNFKHSELSKNILIILAQVFISTSSILMIR